MDANINVGTYVKPTNKYLSVMHGNVFEYGKVISVNRDRKRIVVKTDLPMNRILSLSQSFVEPTTSNEVLHTIANRIREAQNNIMRLKNLVPEFN